MPKFKKTLVSVIIPAFNCEKWISQTIESVLAQTYKNIEIIVVNDGSTDNTPNILKKYNVEENIHIYHIKNSGPAVARNYGVSQATGNIITFLDADDLWESNKIERQLEYFINNNCNLLLTDIKLIDEHNNVIGFQEKRVPLGNKEQTIQFFQGKINQNTPTIMVKKSIFNEVGGFNSKLKHREDHFFLMQVAFKYGVSHMREQLVRRRVWNNSMSNAYKMYKTDADAIINHFNATRFPFYNICIKTFPFLKFYLDKELGKYYNNLSHKLMTFGHIHHARRFIKVAISNDKRLKYCLWQTNNVGIGI